MVRQVTTDIVQLINHSPRIVHFSPSPPPVTSWLMETHTDPHEIQDFCNAIHQGSARIMSDGSYKDGQSAAAYGTVGFTNSALHGSIRIPGRQADQCSYRSELGGILANLTHVNNLCNTNNIKQGAVEIGCDSETALRNVFNKHPITTKMASRDLLQACRHQLNVSLIQWTPRHVRGHQDTHHGTLDEWAISNIDCDLRANERREQGEATPPHILLSGETWRLRINGEVINSNIAETLSEHCSKDEAYDYWVERGRIAPNCKDKVDWSALKRATSIIPTSRLIFLAKNYAGYNPTGKVMLRRKQWPTNSCPRCQQEEDHQHVIRCPAASASEQFT